LGGKKKGLRNDEGKSLKAEKKKGYGEERKKSKEKGKGEKQNKGGTREYILVNTSIRKGTGRDTGEKKENGQQLD